MSIHSSPKREKFFESRKYSGLVANMEDNVNYNATEDAAFLWLEHEETAEENFQTQAALVGSRAKQKFWELFKSERKFKDFDPNDGES